MISFQEFLRERTISSKKHELRDNPKFFEYYNYELNEFREALQNGDNPNTLNANNDTPLFYVVKFDDIKYAKILVEFGANINHQNAVKRTPLHVAIMHDNIKSVKYLIENGADITIKDKDNNTPLHYARTGEVVDYLIKHMKQNNIPMENLNA